MFIFEFLREWTLVQGETWYEIAFKAFENFDLPVRDIIRGTVAEIYTQPPGNAVKAWERLQTGIARRPPNTALVAIFRPRQAHQDGGLVIYKIDNSTKLLVEAHYKFLCKEE